MPESFDLRDLGDAVYRRLGGKIKKAHIKSVVGLIFDEFLSLLIKDKKIKIINFGTFYLKKIKGRSYFDYQTRLRFMSKGKYKLSIKTYNTFKKFILKNADQQKIKENFFK